MGTVERASLWLMIRGLGLVLITLVLLLRVATPRTSTMSGEHLVAPVPLRRESSARPWKEPKTLRGRPSADGNEECEPDATSGLVHPEGMRVE